MEINIFKYRKLKKLIILQSLKWHIMTVNSNNNIILIILYLDNKDDLPKKCSKKIKQLKLPHLVYNQLTTIKYV